MHASRSRGSRIGFVVAGLLSKHSGRWMRVVGDFRYPQSIVSEYLEATALLPLLVMGCACSPTYERFLIPPAVSGFCL